MNIILDKMSHDDISCIEKDFSVNFDDFWSANTLKNDFNNENSYYIIAKADDMIMGFAGIKVILDEAEIMNIVVKKTKRNLGIGSLLLKSLIELSQNLNCNTLFLEVNENNVSAIHLYEKYNFKRIGLRKKYYNNTDNAILMRRITNEESK